MKVLEKEMRRIGVLELLEAIQQAFELRVPFKDLFDYFATTTDATLDVTYRNRYNGESIITIKAKTEQFIREDDPQSYYISFRIDWKTRSGHKVSIRIYNDDRLGYNYKVTVEHGDDNSTIFYPEFEHVVKNYSQVLQYLRETGQIL